LIDDQKTVLPFFQTKNGNIVFMEKKGRG